MQRKILYSFVMWLSGFAFAAWRMHMFTPAIHTFMSNYGAHGLGCFGLLLFMARILCTGSEIKRVDYDRTLLQMSGILLGVTTIQESVQIFIPNRRFDWWDLVAQLVGCLLAYLLARFWPYNNRMTRKLSG